MHSAAAAFAPMAGCTAARASAPAQILFALAAAAPVALLLGADRVCGAAAETAESSDRFVRTASGLEFRDYRVGTGRAAQAGDEVTVRWTGRLADRYGWPFQRESEEAVMVRLGGGTMEGFSEGVVGMREGGKRRLVVPKALGYSREGQEPLPSDYGDRRRLYSTVLNKRRFESAGGLVIDVELKRCRAPRV
jgi:FKBP-type peptidyl-prolyl cis-trans isomerase FkpA